MHVVVAPDSFKGTASAREVASAIGRAVAAAGASGDEVPLADGGEGFVDVLGGPNRVATVTGPLGEPVEAGWRLERGRLAVVEMASASGLGLVGGAEGNDPVAASTYGTGELIGHAVEAGASRVLVGVGGSATTDGGLGALRALYPTPRLRGVEVVVACDVRTRFLDAAEVFAPQKGASPAQVALLRRRLERLAGAYRDDFGVDVTDVEGSGAGGGLAGALAAVGGELCSGFEVVADEVGLEERLERADLVVTGEGFLDEESFDGKVVGGVVFSAVPEGLEVVSLVERFGAERSRRQVLACVEEAVAARLAAP